MPIQRGERVGGLWDERDHALYTNLEEKSWWLEQREWMMVKGDKAQRYFWGSHWSFHPGSIVVTWFGAGRELAGRKWFTNRKTWRVTEDIPFNSYKHHSAGEILHLHRDFQLLSYSIMWRHLCLLLWEQSTYIYFQHLAGHSSLLHVTAFNILSLWVLWNCAPVTSQVFNVTRASRKKSPQECRAPL